jgi:hypothetical protein
MKSAEDLIDLILVLMIGVCIFVFVFPIEFPDGLFGKKNPQDNSQGIGPGAPFKITPAPASASNSWWQWLSYLFTMPEGYMGHDQVAAALKAMGGNSTAPAVPNYDYPSASLPDPGGAIGRFTQNMGIA